MSSDSKPLAVSAIKRRISSGRTVSKPASPRALRRSSRSIGGHAVMLRRYCYPLTLPSDSNPSTPSSFASCSSTARGSTSFGGLDTEVRGLARVIREGRPLRLLAGCGAESRSHLIDSQVSSVEACHGKVSMQHPESYGLFYLEAVALELLGEAFVDGAEGVELGVRDEAGGMRSEHRGSRVRLSGATGGLGSQRPERERGDGLGGDGGADAPLLPSAAVDRSAAAVHRVPISRDDGGLGGAAPPGPGAAWKGRTYARPEGTNGLRATPGRYAEEPDNQPLV